MKRALTISTATMVAIGMIFMLGFAGSAAAYDGGDDGDGASVTQSLNQGNANGQFGGAAAYSEDKGDSNAGVAQIQNVAQNNIGGNLGIALDLIDYIGMSFQT